MSGEQNDATGARAPVGEQQNEEEETSQKAATPAQSEAVPLPTAARTGKRRSAVKLLSKRVSALASDFNKLQVATNSAQRKTESELKKLGDELSLARVRLAKAFRALEQSETLQSDRIMERIGDYISSRDESSTKQIALLRKEYEAKLKRSLKNKSENRSSAVKRKKLRHG